MFNMKSIKKRILGFSNCEKGFTLIEIIAVLVILGILAAVALPKYADLQEAARTLSAQAGVNELIARGNTGYAREVSLRATNGGNISGIDIAAVAGHVNALNLGDYVGTFPTSGNISINSVQGTPITPIYHQWILPVF